MRPRALAAGGLALALLTGCAQSVDPIQRLSAKAAQRVAPHGPAAAERPYRRWGLATPLPPAPKPSRASPARTTARGLPPVVSRVRTRDKVVFLTYDDGAGRNPRFAAMVRELGLPVSVFAHHRTLGHPALRGLPYAGQRAEICGRHNRSGARPRLFRPPYGTYDRTTLRAAADCGISALVLWRASMTGSGELTYRKGGARLRPGDIVAVDPDEGTGPGLPQRTARLLRRVQEAGLTVGRLEDYV